jgi:hypothetical protein
MNPIPEEARPKSPLSPGKNTRQSRMDTRKLERQVTVNTKSLDRTTKSNSDKKFSLTSISGGGVEEAKDTIKKSRMEKTLDIFQNLKKSKTELHHISMELLNTKQVTSKHKPVFEAGGPKGEEMDRQSRSSMLLGGPLQTGTFENNVNFLSIRTGYKSQKSPMGEIPERESSLDGRQSEFLKSPVKNYRMSVMFSASAQTSPEKHASKSTISLDPDQLANKNFKEWYLIMLKNHDITKMDGNHTNVTSGLNVLPTVLETESGIQTPESTTDADARKNSPESTTNARKQSQESATNARMQSQESTTEAKTTDANARKQSQESTTDAPILKPDDKIVPNIIPKKIDYSTPTVFSLETMFGSRTDPIDPFRRIQWMTDCFLKIQNDPSWQSTEKESPEVTSTLKFDISSMMEEEIKDLSEDSTTFPGITTISSGKIKSLLDRLIFPVDQDDYNDCYTKTFLNSYRFLITAHELYAFIMFWYTHETVASTDNRGKLTNQESLMKKLKSQIEKRCREILLTWINNYWIDFQTRPSLYKRLDEFVQSLGKNSFSNNQNFVHAIREQRLMWYTLQFIPMFSGGKVNQEGKALDTDWNEVEFAHNLTIIDYFLFRRITPDVYIQIMSNPATVECGEINLPIKIILESFQWFQMVLFFN